MHHRACRVARLVERAVQRDSAVEDADLLARYAQLARGKNAEVASFAA